MLIVTLTYNVNHPADGSAAIYSEAEFDQMNGQPHAVTEGRSQQIGPVYNDIVRHVYGAHSLNDAMRWIKATAPGATVGIARF